MGRIKHILKAVILGAVAVFTLCTGSEKTFAAKTYWAYLDNAYEEDIADSKETTLEISSGFVDEKGTRSLFYSIEEDYFSWYDSNTFLIQGKCYEKTVFKVNSSNKDVLTITEDSFTVNGSDFSSDYYEYIDYKVVGYGESTITISYEDKIETIKVYVFPKHLRPTLSKQENYNEIKLVWDKQPIPKDAIYNIYKCDYDEKNWPCSFKKVASTRKNYYKATVEWDKQSYYFVCPYVKVDAENSFGVTDKTFTYYPDAEKDKLISISAPKVEITSVKQSGRKANLRWTKNSQVKSYIVYGSVNENGPFKKLTEIKDKNKNSYSFKKAPLGENYYFKVSFRFPDGRVCKTESKSIYMKNSAKLKAMQKTISLKLDYREGQYSGNWSDSDDTYYYKYKNLLHIVTCTGGKLYDYKLDTNNNIKLFKKINLDKNGHFGGFYKGTDDKLYVAIGYDNPKESKNKTVIKVIQYSSTWKKLKICNIKGGVVNCFEGIYRPFDAANCRMDMNGSTLYLTTGRTMFKGNDGLRHQSNIDFVINTKSMKLKCIGPSYVSHSFNQFVKFQNGNLYLLNHGDAYPRCAEVHIVKDFAKATEASVYSNVFSFQGEIGANYTGAYVGGMEVGDKNVLTVGVSVPHNKKVAGISGSGYDLRKNVYLTVTDKETGKNRFIWLTKFHPNKSNTEVSEARIVKVTNYRFVVLFTTTTNERTTLNYVVVNDNGKIVLRKTYNNITFNAGSQPIVHDGFIVWADAFTKKKEVVDTWGYTYYDYSNQTVLCKVPVILDK